MCRAEDFDVAVVDIRMPNMNGVDCLRRIRAARPGAKVVMMTAYSDQELLDMAIEGGALGVMNKPLIMADLLNLLVEIARAGVVMVADDDPDFVASLTEYLGDEGHNVVVAWSGEEALAKLISEDVDALVLDLRLPGRDGLEVYLELKKRGREVPTIMVGVFAEVEAKAIDRLRAMSVTNCFTKPIDPRALGAAVQAIIEEAR